MANEIQAGATPGITAYCVLISSVGEIWNGLNLVVINSLDWDDYDISMTEATAGIYLADMPMLNAGAYTYIIYEQAGVSPAITDIQMSYGRIVWDGDEAFFGIFDFSEALKDIKKIKSTLRRYSIEKGD